MYSKNIFRKDHFYIHVDRDKIRAWTSEEGDACATSNEARTTNCSRLAPPPSRFLCVSESFVTRPRTRAINVSERSNGWYDVNSPLSASLYRSTSPRPPRDSICQLVSGDSFNPCLVLLTSLLLRVFVSRLRVSFPSIGGFTFYSFLYNLFEIFGTN